jgi:hypothetical protein
MLWQTGNSDNNTALHFETETFYEKYFYGLDLLKSSEP